MENGNWLNDMNKFLVYKRIKNIIIGTYGLILLPIILPSFIGGACIYFTILDIYSTPIHLTIIKCIAGCIFLALPIILLYALFCSIKKTDGKHSNTHDNSNIFDNFEDNFEDGLDDDSDDNFNIFDNDFDNDCDCDND